ncbi:CvpA family protein [Sediminicola luteus]|uniref:Colicin V production protein n=1 Tax=Sediminicola luteus TaxID=319238 RepID=A0A2A4G5C3_9FLAO|nr:CvpA family protein [Sediminicola luteus]PCE62942.1 colicin V production protein [Sediminicola luteus]
MPILDIVIGILLFWGLYKGFSNGLFVELASLVALIAGIFGAIHFSYIAEDYLHQNMEWDSQYIKILAFVITFAAIVIGVSMAGKLLTKIADFAMLGGLNKLLGAVFGALKNAVIIGALIIFFHNTLLQWGWVDKEIIEESVFYEPIKDIGDFIFDAVLRDTDEPLLEV